VVKLILTHKPYKCSTQGQGELDGLECSKHGIEGKKNMQKFCRKTWRKETALKTYM